MRAILLFLSIVIGVASLLVAAYMGTHPAARLGLQTQHLLSAVAWAVGGLTAAGLLAAAAAALGLLRQIRDRHQEPVPERPARSERPAAPAFGAAGPANETPAGPRLRKPTVPTPETRGPETREDADLTVPTQRPRPRL